MTTQDILATIPSDELSAEERTEIRHEILSPVVYKLPSRPTQLLGS